MTPRFMLTLALFGIMASATVAFAEFQRTSSSDVIDTVAVSEIIKRSSSISEGANDLLLTENSGETSDFDPSFNPPSLDEWVEQEGESGDEGDAEKPGSEFLKRLIDTTQ